MVTEVAERLSDLTSGSSSLAFIKNMKSLTTLVLPNGNLFGSIPSNISEYTNLTMLDLSFNNLTGEIPASLFGLSSLSYLSPFVSRIRAKMLFYGQEIGNNCKQ